MQVEIPAVLYRGGTSKGPLFLASDLPSDQATRDAVLIAAMGSPHPRQIDGLGGAESLTSKVAGRSARRRPSVDFPAAILPQRRYKIGASALSMRKV